LDLVYPERHRALAGRIAHEGALVSEVPLGTPARAPHFPRRNRIIAALALGTLVVEASLRSGSLITARLAAESGREVFALPGSLQNPLARGCHRLIRDGATLVECAGDVLEQLRPLVAGLRAELDADEPDPQPGDAPSGANADPPADAEARRLLAALGHDPVTVDEAAARSGIPITRLAALLPLLELEGRVECLAGARYARVRGRAR
jgi:DNA processing protein